MTIDEARKGFEENRKAGYKHGYSDGYAKAIDEFVERIKAESYNGYVTLEDYSEDTIESVALEDIEHIAEQLKAGAKHDN